jgi:uncharacterized membrane protein
MNFSNNAFLIFSIIYSLAVISIISLIIANRKVKDYLILFNVVILVYSLVIPAVLTKDPILGGDLGRELFISHGIKETHSIESLGVRDQIAFTGHAMLGAIFQLIVSLNILQIHQLLYLVFTCIITVLSYKLALYTSGNKMIAYLLPLIIVSQQIFLYGSQQGLRSLGWIVLFATAMLTILRLNFQYRVLLIILLISCATYYYTYALLGVFLFIILISILYTINKGTKGIIALTLIYSIASILWNFMYNPILYYSISGIVKGIISSLSEILSVSKAEVNYIESFESTLSWKITLLVNVIYVLIIEVAAFLAFFSLIRQRKELKENNTFLFLTACALWGGTITALTLFNIGLRLSVGINRVLGLSIVPALLYLCISSSKLSKMFKNNKDHKKSKLYNITRLFLLILILVTYVVNTGTLHAVLHEDGFTYLDREGGRYLLWSVPLADSVGYDFMVKYYQGGNILAHTYADNIQFLLFSSIPLNQSSLLIFHSIFNRYVSFNYDDTKNSLVFIRYTNIKTGQIFLGGVRLGYPEELNMSKLIKTMNKVYDNGFFYLFEN